MAVTRHRQRVRRWRGQVVYEPAGKAAEYAGLAATLYETCPHGCRYCFVPGLPHMVERGWSAAEFHTPAVARRDVVARLERDLAGPYLAGRRGEPILFCFACDPFPAVLASVADEVTEAALARCADAGQAVTLLTKRPHSAALLLGQMLRERRWRDVVRGWTLAATVTTMDQREASAAEPLADTVGMRLWGLREAQDMGLARWVSAEPCESPAVARDVVLGVAGIVDEVRVGRLHHGGGDPDAAGWRKFREWAERASGSRSLQGTRVVVKRETGG